MDADWEEDDGPPAFPWPLWIPAVSWILHGLVVLGFTLYLLALNAKFGNPIVVFVFLIMAGLTFLLLGSGIYILHGSGLAYISVHYLSYVFVFLFAVLAWKT